MAFQQVPDNSMSAKFHIVANPSSAKAPCAKASQFLRVPFRPIQNFSSSAKFHIVANPSSAKAPCAKASQFIRVPFRPIQNFSSNVYVQNVGRPSFVEEIVETQVIEEEPVAAHQIHHYSENVFVVERVQENPQQDEELIKARNKLSIIQETLQLSVADLDCSNVSVSATATHVEETQAEEEINGEHESNICHYDEGVEFTDSNNFNSSEDFVRKEKPMEPEMFYDVADDSESDVFVTPKKKVVKQKSRVKTSCSVNRSVDPKPKIAKTTAEVTNKANIGKATAKASDKGKSSKTTQKASDMAKIIKTTANAADKTELCKKVMNILPKEHGLKMYDYKSLSAEERINAEGRLYIHATVRVNVSTAEEAVNWLSAFEKSSYSDYRTMKTWGDLETSKRLDFKKKYRCHHDTLAEKSGTKSPHEKHTACEARLTITVKHSQMPWSTDDLLQTHPCEVLLHNEHNHDIDPYAGDILRHRRPSPEVREKFINMFQNLKVPHSAATALDAYLTDLELENPLCFQVGDGSLVPNMSWVRKLCMRLMKDKCGDPYGPGLLSALEKYVADYNIECKDICAKMGVTEDGQNHFIAVCSPMMKRIHTDHKASGEVMFIDSSGSMDNNNARVFVILTPSVVCGLPLGLLITYSEKEEVVTAALECWKEILPQNAFYGRGLKGPKIIISDDSTSERNSLKNCFPLAILLLCVFHVLQAMWRYVWDSSHEVSLENRAEIYFKFRQILYAPTVDEFNDLYDEAMEDELLNAHSAVLGHFKELRLRATEWAMCFRAHLLTRGHNTNNYCEAAMRLIKDLILFRIRAFNTAQLLEYLVTRLDSYYKRKLSFFINNRIEGFRRSRYCIKPEKLIPLVATKLQNSENLYKVLNNQKTTEYLVDIDLEICSCPVGMCGAPCKHQYCVVKTYNVTHHQFFPDQALKTVFFFIMNGTREVPEGFFKTLKGDQQDQDMSTLEDFDQVAPLETGEDNLVPQIPEDIATETSAPDSSAEMEERLMAVSRDLAEKYKSSPDYLFQPLEKFLKSYWSLVKAKNHDSTLASALATFAKDFTHLQPARRQSMKPILIQPTSFARREVFTGGRHAQKGGRPNKQVAQAREHGYSELKRKAAVTGTWATPPSKNAKVPHSLSQCVVANCRLPK